MNNVNIFSKFQEYHYKELKKGEFIYEAGDDPSNIYYLESGLIGLYSLSSDGQETFLRIFTKGSIFGHRSFFANEKYHANSLTLKSSKIWVMPVKGIENEFKKNPNFIIYLVTLLAIELGDAERRMSSLASHSAFRRIAETLVYLNLKYPEHKWKRKEIAHYAVTTIETLTRVLSQLEEKKLIQRKGREILIPDTNKLLTNF